MAFKHGVFTSEVPDKHSVEVEKNFGGISENPVELDGNILLDTLEVSSSDTATVILEDTIDYMISTDEDTGETSIDIIVGRPFPADVITISYDVGTDSVITDCSVADLPYILPSNATSLLITAEETLKNVLTADIDYTAAYNSDNKVEFAILDDDKIFNDTITIKYKDIDPSLVTEADIIGGVDPITGDNKGLEVIEDVFPNFRLVPNIILAPKFSKSPAVAAIMKTKCTNINSVFRAIAICDIPSDEVINYTNAPEYKNSKNLVDPASQLFKR